MPTSIFTEKKIVGGSDWIVTNNTYSGCDMVATITINTQQGSIAQVIGSLQTISVSTSQNKMPVRCLGDINAKDYVDGPRTIAGSLIFTVFDRHWSKDIRDQLIGLGVYQNKHIIADEFPPFDVTISFANEYGYESRMAIKGIRIMTEGQTMSINDIYTENTYQYVAMDIDYMDSVGFINGQSDNIPANIGDVSGEVIDIVKPKEVIPETSTPEIVPRPPVSQKLDDDFSYSRIVPESFLNLKEYKSSLLKQKDLYLDKAKQLYDPDSKETKNKYDALRQEIANGYSAKLKLGIQYFS